MKIGILCCGFSCHEKLDERMLPWFFLSKEFNLVFSVISCRFKEYEELNINQDNTTTRLYLENLYDDGKIQYLRIPDESLSEAEARNLALKPLLDNSCDYVWLLDLSDEYYTELQIRNIINYIQKEEFVTWFSIPFKNYVFDEKQWIGGFCPPRIFKVNNSILCRLKKCYWDNDFEYDIGSGISVSYKNLSNKSIPLNLINNGVKHLTWLHSNGKNKVAYQEKHFGVGNCSYKWNNKENKLEFNLDYYKKHNIPLPTVYIDI